MRTITHTAARLAAVLGLALCLAGCRLAYTGGARPVAPSELDGEWLRAAPTPVVRQTQRSDCGLAALAMVAGTWGHRWSLGELSAQLAPTERGVRLGALRDLARARGLEAYAIGGTHADLRRELAEGRPVLVGLVLPFERDRASSHFEVAVAVHPRDGSVVTLDPSTGEHLRRAREVFDAEWQAASNATLVVVGKRARAASPSS